MHSEPYYLKVEYLIFLVSSYSSIIHTHTYTHTRAYFILFIYPFNYRLVHANEIQ